MGSLNAEDQQLHPHPTTPSKQGEERSRAAEERSGAAEERSRAAEEQSGAVD